MRAHEWNRVYGRIQRRCERENTRHIRRSRTLENSSWMIPVQIASGSVKTLLSEYNRAVQKIPKIKQSGRVLDVAQSLSTAAARLPRVRTMLFARRHNSEFLVDKAAQPSRRINFAGRREKARERGSYMSTVYSSAAHRAIACMPVMVPRFFKRTRRGRDR